MTSDNVAEIRQKLRDRAKVDFMGRVGEGTEYKVSQLHYGRSDVCKLWRCGTKRAAYHFLVLSFPGTLMVQGDMGTYVWSREYDMISFANEAVNDLDYFSGKLVVPVTAVEQVDELVESWLRTGIKSAVAEAGFQWDKAADDTLKELRAVWRETNDIDSMLRHYMQSESFGPLGPESFPSLSYYSYRYLWSVEGLKWFLSQLRSGNVEIAAEMDEETSISRAIESATQLCATFGISGSVKFPDCGSVSASALPVVDLSGYKWEAIEGAEASTGRGVLRVMQDDPDGDSEHPQSNTVLVEPLTSYVDDAEELKAVFPGKSYTTVVAYWHGFDCGPCLVMLENALRASLEE